MNLHLPKAMHYMGSHTGNIMDAYIVNDENFGVAKVWRNWIISLNFVHPKPNLA